MPARIRKQLCHSDLTLFFNFEIKKRIRKSVSKHKRRSDKIQDSKYIVNMIKY